MDSLPRIILITGIMAAGKSTVAQALAERLPKSVHLRGDIYRRMIVNGRAEMSPDGADEAYRQLRLRYALAAQTADLYAREGFTVVAQDVIIGAELRTVADMLASSHPTAVVVLCPPPQVAAQRDIAREKTGYGIWTAEQLDAGLRADTPRIGLWLDNGALTVSETVDAILAQLGAAVYTPAQPPANPDLSGG